MVKCTACFAIVFCVYVKIYWINSHLIKLLKYNHNAKIAQYVLENISLHWETTHCCIAEPLTYKLHIVLDINRFVVRIQ